MTARFSITKTKEMLKYHEPSGQHDGTFRASFITLSLFGNLWTIFKNNFTSTWKENIRV